MAHLHHKSIEGDGFSWEALQQCLEDMQGLVPLALRNLMRGSLDCHKVHTWHNHVESDVLVLVNDGGTKLNHYYNKLGSLIFILSRLFRVSTYGTTASQSPLYRTKWMSFSLFIKYWSWKVEPDWSIVYFALMSSAHGPFHFWLSVSLPFAWYASLLRLKYWYNPSKYAQGAPLNFRLPSSMPSSLVFESPNKIDSWLKNCFFYSPPKAKESL